MGFKVQDAGLPTPVESMTGPRYPLEPNRWLLQVTGLPVMSLPAPVPLSRQDHFLPQFDFELIA